MNISNGMKRHIIVEIIVFFFILLFVYAGVSKLMDLQKFRIQIGQSPILANIAGLVAIAVPLIEVLIAIALVFPKTRLPGLLASLCLMIMFTTYIVLIMNSGEHIPCSCGGVLQQLNWRDHLIFNIVFVILGILGTFLQYNNPDKKTSTIKNILLQ